MAYNPQNMGRYLPQAYPGNQTGSYPGIPGNYMTAPGYQGSQAQNPSQYSYPGATGYPLAQSGQRYQVYPANGGVGVSPGAGYHGQANPATYGQFGIGQYYNQVPGMMQYPNQESQRPRRFSNPGMQQAVPIQQSISQQSFSPMGKHVKPKQFNLSSLAQGFSATGIALMPDGNTFSLTANNLPGSEILRQMFPNLGPSPVYMAYLTNRKGQGAFSVGQLFPVGGGTYKAAFQSNVPFYDYDQVVVTVENPYTVQNFPSGPLILSNTSNSGLSIPKPVTNFFAGIWEKVKGIIQKKESSTPVPEAQLQSPSLLSNYTIGPQAPPNQLLQDLPGLGAPAEDPQKGGNP